LTAAADGDSAVAKELLPIAYDELRSLAASYFRRERDHHTRQSTALVHEAFLKLVDQTSIQSKGRNHFFVVAAGEVRGFRDARRHAPFATRQRRRSGIRTAGYGRLSAYIDDAVLRLAEWRSPWRCCLMTVFGFTISRRRCHLIQGLDRPTRKTRSRRSLACSTGFWRAVDCWQNAKSSATAAERGRGNLEKEYDNARSEQRGVVGR